MTAEDSMDLRELRKHARALAEELPAPLRRIRLGSGELHVEIEWQEPPAGGAQAALLPPAPAGASGRPVATEPEPDGPPLTHITSPMVGTFYRAPEPGAPPFVSVGDVIGVGQTIGIVEAMKLMNPITAECSGTVTEVLAANAESVEFGQPLISLTAASG